MAEVSAKSFLGLLQKSGLCDPAELKATIGELFKKVNGSTVKLDQITEHLLQNGMVSEWHLKKLLAGKYKGFFLGKYKLLGHLGTGGMSTVYLAQHTIFNQKRALKVLPRDRVADKTYLARFYREGRAAAALNHRNIVRVYDIGAEGDTHYLVMEYVKGEDIYEKVNRDGPLPYDKAVDYMIQAATGLQHAHENDLVHRDIKPANLLVTPDGDVKILDLGLAMFQEDDASLTVMNNERVLGTADYLSPEQAVDSHNVDSRSDIYSAGCTMYFMLTGKPPFHEGTIAQRLARHQSREPEDIREYRADCPVDLLDLVHRMMRKKAEERYDGCQTLAAELRRISDDLLLLTPTINTSVEKPKVQKKESVQVKAVAETAPAIAKKPSAKPAKKLATKPIAKPTANKPKSAVKSAVKPAVKAAEKSAEKSAAIPPQQKTKQAVPKPRRKADERVASPEKRSAKPPAKPTSKPTKKTTAKPAAKTTEKPFDKLAKKPASKKVAAQEPVPQGKSKSAPPANTESAVPKKTAAVIDIAGKPKIDPAQLSVILPQPESSTSQVGVNEFRSFVAKNRSTRKQSVKPKRDTRKQQLMIAGLVIGMLLLLGLVLVVAKSFVNVKENKTGQVESGNRMMVSCETRESSLSPTPEFVVAPVVRDSAHL